MRNSLSAATETCAGPNDMPAQAASSVIQAGSSREMSGPTSTSMTSVPPRPLRRTTENFCPCRGCHGYTMTALPNRYVECRLVPPPVAEDKESAGFGVFAQLLLGGGPQAVETESQIARRGGHEHLELRVKT